MYNFNLSEYFRKPTIWMIVCLSICLIKYVILFERGQVNFILCLYFFFSCFLTNLVAKSYLTRDAQLLDRAWLNIKSSWISQSKREFSFINIITPTRYGSGNEIWSVEQMLDSRSPSALPLPAERGPSGGFLSMNSSTTQTFLQIKFNLILWFRTRWIIVIKYTHIYTMAPVFLARLVIKKISTNHS